MLSVNAKYSLFSILLHSGSHKTEYFFEDNYLADGMNTLFREVFRMLERRWIEKGCIIFSQYYNSIHHLHILIGVVWISEHVIGIDPHQLNPWS